MFIGLVYQLVKSQSGFRLFKGVLCVGCLCLEGRLLLIRSRLRAGLVRVLTLSQDGPREVWAGGLGERAASFVGFPLREKVMHGPCILHAWLDEFRAWVSL